MRIFKIAMDIFYNFTTVYNADDEVLSFETDNPIFDTQLKKDEISICAKNIFGISSLFPWQRLAISNILDGVNEAEKNTLSAKNDNYEDYANAQKSNIFFDKNSNNENNNAKTTEQKEMGTSDFNQLSRQIILLPTGAGKSLCFQVPAILLPTPTLVVYPLLALMSDQVRRLKECGINPVLLQGGQTSKERSEALFRIKNFEDPENGVKLIIANPEILQNEKILSTLEKVQISHFAIDEAHCVSEWGESFRPSYLKLKDVINRIKPKAITAFTATASEDILERVSNILFDGNAHVVRGATDRPNIYYYVKPCRVKYPALLQVISKEKKPIVVFASTREGTERIASFLKYSFNHDNVRFYHAGLERAEKDKTEKWFNVADDGILVATCAWGMGVDKKNIRTVVHFEVPLTTEAYVQEAGRGGRDGKLSKAILLWSHEDLYRLKNQKGISKSRAERLIEYATAKTCRRRILLKTLGDVNASSNYAEMRNVHCTGCDVCDNVAEMQALDERYILNFIRENKKVYTQQEFVEYLQQILVFWCPKDLNKLLQILKSEGKIVESNSLFWKRKLKIAKTFLH